MPSPARRRDVPAAARRIDPSDGLEISGRQCWPVVDSVCNKRCDSALRLKAFHDIHLLLWKRQPPRSRVVLRSVGPLPSCRQ